MNIVVSENQIKTLIKNKELDEGFFGSLIRQVPKTVKKIVPSFISKTTLKTLSDEIHRLIPKQYLTNPKEVSTMISRLHSLGPNLNKINGNYITKYGKSEYDRILRKYLFDGIDKKTFISQLKTVKNPNFKIKPILGYGADHQVYEMVTHPDKIIKVELRPGEVDKWYNVFNSHPDVFPKAHKKVKVKDKNGQLVTAAVMEKLDVGPFHKLWDEMEKMLQASQKNLTPAEKTGLEYLVKRRDIYKSQWDNFLKYLKVNRNASSNKIDEFIKLVDKLYSITPKPDIRKFNLGYDKSGILKSLDL